MLTRLRHSGLPFCASSNSATAIQAAAEKEPAARPTQTPSSARSWRRRIRLAGAFLARHHLGHPHSVLDLRHEAHTDHSPNDATHNMRLAPRRRATHSVRHLRVRRLHARRTIENAHGRAELPKCVETEPLHTQNRFKHTHTTTPAETRSFVAVCECRVQKHVCV